MFDYRFNRNADEYTARLRKEAHEARLARGAKSRLARFAARTFRSWANRIDGDAARGVEALAEGLWREAPRSEAHVLS